MLVAGESASAGGGIVIALALRLLDIADANTCVMGGRVLVGLGQGKQLGFHDHGWTNYRLAWKMKIV